MSADDAVKKGSPFPESVKLESRRLAFFRCCYCHDRPGDEVHHLDPQEDGGQGALENAILLCARCHTDYGHQPARQIRVEHEPKSVQKGGLSAVIFTDKTGESRFQDDIEVPKCPEIAHYETADVHDRRPILQPR